MFLRKGSNGFWYVSRVTSSNRAAGRDSGTWRDWWLVKHHGNRRCGFLAIKNITLPAEFVGKKIRLRVEIIEEE